MLTEADFNEYAAQGFNRIPVVLSLFADLDTPLSVYLKLANRPYSYLLESVVGGERSGRYSLIGLPSHTRLRVNGLRVQVEHGHSVIETHEGDPLKFIAEFQKRFKTPEQSDLPRFTGGLVGYFAYETVKLMEPKLAVKPAKPDPIGAPDILLMLSEELAVVDNVSGKLFLVVYADPALPNSYQKALARLNELRTTLRKPLDMPLSMPSTPTVAQSEFGEHAFKDAVQTIRRYIFEGDVMQVVPSQRMSMPFSGTPLALYRALRSLNPSPYMFFYHFDDFHLVGSSPEILVRQEQNRITVRPIAGTRPRGHSRDIDEQLAIDLLNDPKEIAEHVMLIDLGRNDVGRVSQVGSVKLTEKMTIERYSHVMHIVSNVEGELAEGVDNLDVLKATFPAGTLSGAPKIRAMEIIDEVEPSKRGVYGGAVGYLGFNGEMDLAIAIRTAIVKDGTLFVQAGAGVVADSNPDSEWQETCNKARAVLRAAEFVQAGLDA